MRWRAVAPREAGRGSGWTSDRRWRRVTITAHTTADAATKAATTNKTMTPRLVGVANSSAKVRLASCDESAVLDAAPWLLSLES